MGGGVAKNGRQITHFGAPWLRAWCTKAESSCSDCYSPIRQNTQRNVGSPLIIADSISTCTSMPVLRLNAQPTSHIEDRHYVPLMFAAQVKIPASAVRAVCRSRTGMDDDADVLRYLSASLVAAAEAVDAGRRRRRQRCNDRIRKCLPASEDTSTVLADCRRRARQSTLWAERAFDHVKSMTHRPQ